VYDNQDKAVDFIKQLGKVYHYLLEVRTSELVDVDHELQFIYAYNYLLQIRFDKALSIEVKKDDACKNKMLPPMALQMVIENCTKHNIATLAQPLHITITCLEDKISVSNNIQLRADLAEKSGTGLDNIKERYGFLSDRELVIINDHKNFVVELPLLSAV
jgi:two-component system, LytTR family, sensor kinase